MGYILIGDQQRAVNKRLGEVLRQFGQYEYPYDPERAIHALQAFTEGRFETLGDPFFPSLVHARDIIPGGWEVIADVPPSEFDVSDLEFVPYLKEDEGPISSPEMRQRALEFRGNLGLVDVKRIHDHQGEIPQDFRGNHVVFPGTVLRHPDGGLYVMCLGSEFHDYFLRFVDLDVKWGKEGRFARRKRK